MAKVKYTALMSDMRGKVNGTVFSKNRFAAYARNKVTPVNPSTPSQTGVRARFTGFSQGWRGLTANQRLQWIDATGNFPKTNVFGDTYYLTGAQLYQSLNNSLAVTGTGAMTSPPVPGSVPSVASLVVTMTAGTPTVSLVFTPTPVPASTSFLVYATGGVSPGVSFVKNQYRLIGTIAAAATSPSNQLTNFTTKYGVVPPAGMKVFFKVVPVNTVTGQQGLGFETFCIVGA